MIRGDKSYKMRNKLVDALKGYACFLVVFGHVIMGIRKAGVDIPYGAQNIENFIWTFHVALFMFLSGYVYHTTGEWKSKGSRISFIKHKFINLAIPYFVFSCIYICINSFVGGSNVNSEMSIADIIWLWKKPVAQYWFLYDLFFIFVAFTILNKWLKNWQITLLLAGIKIGLSLADVDVIMPFAAMIRMALPFGIGASINKLFFDDCSKIRKVIIVLTQIVFTEIFLLYSLEKYVVLDMFISIIGCFGSVALISFWVKSTFVNKILLFICKYSFPIYLLHTIFTAGIRVALNKCGMDNYFVHVLVGCFCGLFFSIVGAIIAEKIDMFNFFFYPGKILKKKK